MESRTIDPGMDDLVAHNQRPGINTETVNSKHA